MKNNSKVLVLGGAGFIGSNLVENLSNIVGKHSISVIDNYSTGRHSNEIAGVTYIRGDSRDIEKLTTIIPDYVFHLGEYARVERSLTDFNMVWDSNIIGTKAVVEYCAKVGAKLIYAGSSTKYADNGENKHSTPYTWTKYINTEFIQNYANWYELDYAICYFYNAYGRNEISTGAYATLIGILYQQWLAGKSLTVVEPGTQQRNFTHVDDIVSGLILVAQKGKGDGFGIGADEAYSVIEVAKMFSSDITFLPKRAGNRSSSPLLTAKIKALGWYQSKSLKDFIDELKASK